MEREIKKIVLFKIAQKRIRYIEINVLKNVYSGNYKPLMKKTEDYYTKTNEKIYHAYGPEELILLKWSYYPGKCKWWVTMEYSWNKYIVCKPYTNF